MVADSRRPFLIAAAIVSAVALTGLLGLAAEITGVVVCLVALLAVAQDARETGADVGPLRWWNLILGGLVIWIAGIPIGLLLEPVGGLLVAGGAALCLVGSLLGIP
ncbi:MAG: hypothetical protein ACKOPI_02775 [bacterium]